jgi:hypothetical protein
MIMDSAKANKAKTKEKKKMGDKKPKKAKKDDKKKPVTKIETPKVNEQPAKGKAPAVPKKKK